MRKQKIHTKSNQKAKAVRDNARLKIEHALTENKKQPHNKAMKQIVKEQVKRRALTVFVQVSIESQSPAYLSDPRRTRYIEAQPTQKATKRADTESLDVRSTTKSLSDKLSTCNGFEGEERCEIRST